MSAPAPRLLRVVVGLVALSGATSLLLAQDAGRRSGDGVRPQPPAPPPPARMEPAPAPPPPPPPPMEPAARERVADEDGPPERRSSARERTRGRIGGPVTRLDATVFRVSLPNGGIVKVDPALLAERADSVAALDTALREIGAVQVLYRECQVLRPGVPARLGTNADVPFAAAAKGGPTSVARQDVGVEFRVGYMPADEAGTFDVQVALELAAMGTEVQIEGAAAPVFRKCSQNYTGPLTPGQPIVLVSFDGAAAGADGQASAIVTRIAFATLP